MTVDTAAVVGDAFAKIESAWNAGDGDGFADPFTDDVDFVAVRGDHHRGKEAIRLGHQAIFDTIYRGSTVSYAVDSSAQVADGCVLGIVSSTLDCPGGPLQGVNHSTITAVFVRDGDSWKIRAFQNTLVIAGGGPPPPASP